MNGGRVGGFYVGARLCGLGGGGGFLRGVDDLSSNSPAVSIVTFPRITTIITRTFRFVLSQLKSLHTSFQLRIVIICHSSCNWWGLIFLNINQWQRIQCGILHRDTGKDKREMRKFISHSPAAASDVRVAFGLTSSIFMSKADLSTSSCSARKSSSIFLSNSNLLATSSSL